MVTSRHPSNGYSQSNTPAAIPTMFIQSALPALRALALLALSSRITAQKTADQLREEDYNLSLRILSPPPESYSAGCIEDVLSHGYWEVSNLTFSNRVTWTSDGAKGVQALEFDMGSDLLGWSARCAWEYVGEMFWSTQGVECTFGDDVEGSEAPVMGFKWDEEDEGVVVGVAQTWFCPGGEDDEGTSFELLANIELTPSLDDDGAFTLQQDQLRVPYHITAPISLTPANEVPAPPLGSTDPNCRASSQDTSWTISNLVWAWGTGGRDADYQYTSGYVKIDMVHEPSGHALTCLSLGSGIVPDPEKRPGVLNRGDVLWEYCSGFGHNDSFSGEYLLQTAMLFDGFNEVVELVQSWYCDEDEDNETAVKYVSYGTASIGEVSCQSANDTILHEAFGPDIVGWFLTDAHICTGLPTPTTVPGTIIQESALLPDAFSYQRPREGGCLAPSLVEANWYWDVYPAQVNYRLSEDNTTVEWMQARMDMGIPAIVGDLVCFVPQNRLFGDCDEPILAQARENVAKAVLDPDTLVFSIEQSWECADRSPNHPVRFEAKGSIDLSGYECEGTAISCLEDTIRVPMELTIHQAG